jgi:hypothetical protein
MLQSDFFQIIEEQLDIKISDSDKTGLVHFCGHIHEKTNSIMFDYAVIQEFTSAVEDNPQAFLTY